MGASPAANCERNVCPPNSCRSRSSAAKAAEAAMPTLRRNSARWVARWVSVLLRAVASRSAAVTAAVRPSRMPRRPGMISAKPSKKASLTFVPMDRARSASRICSCIPASAEVPKLSCSLVPALPKAIKVPVAPAIRPNDGIPFCRPRRPAHPPPPPACPVAFMPVARRRTSCSATFAPWPTS